MGMSQEIDISFLDTEEITQKIFPKYFHFSMENMPQSDSSADAYFIEVDENVRLCCKYYVESKKCPTVLFFHDNHETALNQNAFGSGCMKRGINLFVTDYRGYGISDGVPSMTTMFSDCHRIYKYLLEIIEEEDYRPDVFLMGRSLGSMPALELAYKSSKEFKGLIIENGSAMNFNSLWSNADPADIAKLADAMFYNKDRIREVTIPTLIIHGEQDVQVPVAVGNGLFQLSGADDKELVIIPEAGHHDILEKGKTQYFTAIKEFVRKYAPSES
jgi:alpha-beta hydrolase superfamily lysophospholipase